jgi:hypothetical protein
MKISEILVESKQLDEGPLLNKIGSAVGKGVGTVAKGIGAVAGGVAGLGSADKKGFQAGKSTVGGAGDEPTTPAAAGDTAVAAPAKKQSSPIAAGVKQGFARAFSAPAGTAPAAGAAPAPAAGAAPTAQQINKAGPAGAPAAKAQTGKAGQALAKTGAALAGQDTAQAGQTMYAQVKANVDKLDKKGKQRIMQLLQKSLGTPAAAPAPAAPAAAPASKDPSGGKNLGFGFNTDTGKPFASAEERTAAGEAGEMAAREFPAKSAAAKPAVDAGAPAKRGARKPARATQAEIDADRERIMGPNSGESTVRTGKVVAESFSLFRKQ